MKILNQKEFMALPEGILFCEFEPIVFNELQIKSTTTRQSGFYYSDLIEIDAEGSDEAHAIVFRHLENGESIPLHFHTETRSTRYDDSQQYAVLEKHDVTALISRLVETVDAYPEITIKRGDDTDGTDL